MATNKPAPLTPEQRRELVERPFIRETIGGRGWSGASFAHLDVNLKTRSRSVYYDSDNITNPAEGD